MNIDSTTPLFSSRIRQAAGLAAGVAAASSATATIFEFDADVPVDAWDPLTLLPATGEAISNNGQYWQDPLYLHNSGGNYYWFGSNSGYSWATDGSYQMVGFAFNDSIDETTSFQNGASTEWTTEGSVYFGFRYDDAGSYYYGWLHGTFTDGVGFHFDQFAISSTAGATVYAGIDPDLAAIPEPSTTALLFGVVAAGVMFWRRRRSRLAAAVWS